MTCMPYPHKTLQGESVGPIKINIFVTVKWTATNIKGGAKSRFSDKGVPVTQHPIDQMT